MKTNEEMAAALEATGLYRILKRLEPRAGLVKLPDVPLRRGLVLDLETTGLDPKTDEVIEAALLPFTYTLTGDIVEALPAFSKLREPSKPISSKISELTGITNEMVAGHRFDPDEIAAFVDRAEIVIAHNARFDRPFAERLHPSFKEKAWACSMLEVPWAVHGAEGLKLTYLMSMAKLFHDGHRALDDCHAALELLARPLCNSGRTALSHLLEASGKTSTRIWAIGAAYDHKDRLRSRAFKWNAGDNGLPRSWYLDADEASVEAELAVLRSEIFDLSWKPVTTRITAHERFSERA